MPGAVEFIKREIHDFLTYNKVDAECVLNMQALFLQRGIRWNPKQKDALETAINELVTAGILEKRYDGYFLTQKGVDQIYPPVGGSVRDAVLSCFSESHAKAGDVLNARALQHQYILHWNPKQKAALDTAFKQMKDEGLIELKDGNVVLTQNGFYMLY